MDGGGAGGGVLGLAGKKKSNPAAGLVAGYVRKSVLEWPDGCVSVEQRTAYVDDLRRARVGEIVSDAARDKETIDLFYDDMGISGRGEFLEKRVALERMRQDALAGKLRIIYVRDSTRLFRKLRHSEAFFDEMEEIGVEVRGQDIAKSGDRPSDRVNRQVMGSFAEYMAERSSVVVSNNMLQTIQDGQWVGRIRGPYGLAYNAQSKSFDIDPVGVQRALTLFALIIEHGGNTNAVAMTLNQWLNEGDPRAFVGPKGARWHPASLTRMILSPMYQRKVSWTHRWKSRESVTFTFDMPDRIPEVLPVDLVADATRLVLQRQGKTAMAGGYRQSSGKSFVYSGVSVCGYCGSAMRGLSSHSPLSQNGDEPPRLSHVYYCRKALNTPAGCPQSFGVSHRRVDILMAAVLRDALKAAVAATGGSIASAAADASKQQAKRPKSADKPAPPDYDAELRRLDEESRRHRLMYAQGITNSLEELQLDLQRIQGKRDKVMAAADRAGEAAESSAAPKVPILTAAAATAFLRDFEAHWLTSDLSPYNEAKSAFLKALGVSVVIRVQGIRAKTRRQKDDKLTGGPLTVEVQIAALGLTGERTIRAVEDDESFAKYRRGRFGKREQ